ncbi:MAG: 50S ribosomal protein L2 [Candidatus Pacearchaeota archaeon]
MGKRITQQARGKGGPAFTVRKQAYIYKIKYPKLSTEGNAKIVKLFNSSAHSAPLIKGLINKETFIIPAVEGVYEGQEIELNKNFEIGKINIGNITKLKNIPLGTRICSIEKVPGKGPVFMRCAGSFAVVSAQTNNGIEINIHNRRRIVLNENCRATIGSIAAEGRLTKPLVKAGKVHHMMKSIGRKWHRTSPIKVNAVDHPFGSGRGKRIKSKIAQRNASPGQKVGHLRPRRTGRKR